MPTTKQTRARKRPEKPAASRRCAEATGSVLGGKCPDCDGDGEIYVGSSVPDDEGFGMCMACGGSGKLPTIEGLRELREKYLEALGDLQGAQFELEEWKQQFGGNPQNTEGDTRSGQSADQATSVE